MYGPSQLSCNFSSARLDVFSKTLLKTNSLALNVHGFTHRLCQLANLCWYEVMRTTVVKTKLYDVISVCQTSGTATEEIFSPRQRCQKHVKTIFHIRKKMDLLFLVK